MAIPFSQIANAVTNLALVSPLQSQGYQPLSSTDFSDVGDPFVFKIEGENTVEVESDITDNFLQGNTSIEDHIALKPEIVTVHGFVGELVQEFPQFAGPALSVVPGVLAVVGAFAPSFSLSALNIINQAQEAYVQASNAAAGALSAFNSLTGQGSGLNKQQQAFNYFYTLWRNRTLFRVQTPWGLFQPCPILRMRALQDETTNTVTDFYLTFKVINFVGNEQLTGLVQQGRAAQQGAAQVNDGVSPLGPLTDLNSFLP